MSHRSGRHSRRGANTIPVHEFLAGRASTMTAHRRPLNPAVALTAATAIAFAPMVVSQAPPVHLAAAPVHINNVQLTAVVSDADIANLVAAVNSGLNELDSTAANVVGVPGQTLAAVLSTAATLTDGFWSQLQTGAKSNPLLASMLAALRTVTAGGLTQLAATAGAINGPVTLSAEQAATFVTSALTGSAATVLYAISHVVANPLSLLSYAGLVNVPLNIAGGLVFKGAAAVADIGGNGIDLVSNVITGATAQVTNLITAANQLFNGVEHSIDQQQLRSLVAITQAIVTSPLTAGVTIVNGGTAALADAAKTTLDVAATAVQRIGNIWLGDGTKGGALQGIVNTIGSEPLSPASYVNVLGELITAGAQSVNQIGTTVVAGFVPLPFSTSAILVTTAAKALNNLADGVAKATVATLQFMGVPPLLAGTVYGLVGAVETAVTLTGATMSTALNAVSTLLKTASSFTGAYNSVTSTAAVAPKSLVATPAAAAAAIATAETPAKGSDPASGHTSGTETTAKVAAAAKSPSGVSTATEGAEKSTGAKETAATPDTATPTTSNAYSTSSKAEAQPADGATSNSGALTVKVTATQPSTTSTKDAATAPAPSASDHTSRGHADTSTSKSPGSATTDTRRSGKPDSESTHSVSPGGTKKADTKAGGVHHGGNDGAAGHSSKGRGPAGGSGDTGSHGNK
ncbi:hypothetical protein [Mycolicibacterium llatzerense]|uniref:hypothetical protein n=1 Tax=Mycolicibacterium llatzerense TaxID=280871 RepID=UPI0013A6A6E0|nr:hypothetical protein [Mycolicibacterium llatzerense]